MEAVETETKFRSLIDALRRISVSLDLDTVLDVIVKTIKELINFDAAVIAIVDPHTKRIRTVRQSGYPVAADHHFLLEPGQGIIGSVIAAGEGRIVGDVLQDPNYFKGRVETRSEMAAPITTSQGDIIGVINLESDRVHGFTKGDLEVATMFAGIVAIAIEMTLMHRELMEKRRIEDELHLAHQVVEGLLPRSIPLLHGFDIYGMNLSVETVGGDYFDFIEVFDDRLGLLIADVSGKGLPAALIMASFRAYMHATIINEFAARVVMSRVNRLLYDSIAGNKFISAFYGLVDPDTKRMIYINAGHNPPLLIRANGSHELLDDGGFALGIFRESRYSEQIIDLKSGDILVLYTDGVSEAKNYRDEEFGVAGLERVVRENANRRAYQICEAIVAAVKEHTHGSGGLEDDLTISVVKTAGDAAEAETASSDRGPAI